MSEEMSNARKYEISWPLLLRILDKLTIEFGNLEREVGNIAKATGLDKDVINTFMTRGLFVALLSMSDEMETARKYKIGYQVLMYFVRYKLPMKFGGLQRQIGNYSRVTGISIAELNEFMKKMLNDILRIELDDESILAELKIEKA